MSTIREQIVAAITTALNTSRPSNVPEFVRTRLDSPSVQQLPVNTVYQAEELTETMREYKDDRARRGPILRRTLVLKIESLAAADGSTPPDAAVDPSIAWITKTVNAAGNLSRLVDDYGDEMGIKFEYEQGETSLCRATMTYHFEFRTLTGDAEQTGD